VEARRTAALNNAPSCMWSPVPPLELKGVPVDALNANAGFVTFGNLHFFVVSHVPQ
jgi:actin related protein 2/3 complex, subunit 2